MLPAICYKKRDIHLYILNVNIVPMATVTKFDGYVMTLYTTCFVVSLKLYTF